MYVLIIVFIYSITNIVNFIFFLVLWESKISKFIIVYTQYIDFALFIFSIKYVNTVFVLLIAEKSYILRTNAATFLDL